MDASKLLNLEPARVEAMAKAYEGLANSSPFGAPERPAWRRANDLALAGCYWAVLDVKNARNCLSEASSLYFHLAFSENFSGTFTGPRMICASKAVMLAVSAGDTAQVRERAGSWLKQTGHAAAEEVLAKLLTASFLTLEQRDEPYEEIFYGLIEIASSMPAHPAGRLGWPLRAYTQTVGQLVELRREGVDPEHLYRVFAPFAQRVAETVQSAQTTSYHWRRLYSRLLPIEPEVLIICEVAQVLMEKRQSSEEKRRSAFSEFPSASRAYLEVAAEMRAYVNREQRKERPTERGEDFNAPSFS